MARKLLILILTVFLSNCIVKKKTTYGKERSITVEASEKTDVTGTEPKTEVNEKVKPTRADQIINTALTYSGVKYK